MCEDKERKVVGEMSVHVEPVVGPKFDTEAEGEEWARREAERRMNEELRRRGLETDD